VAPPSTPPPRTAALTAQTIGFVASWFTQSVLVGLEVFTAGFLVLLLVSDPPSSKSSAPLPHRDSPMVPLGIDTDTRSSPSHLGHSSIDIPSNSCPSGTPRHHSPDSPGFLARSELPVWMRTRRSSSVGPPGHLERDPDPAVTLGRRDAPCGAREIHRLYVCP
jgi:hypothetical protein